MFWLVVVVCVAPFVAAVIVWGFELQPDARTNVGDLIEPQRPVTGAGTAPIDAATPGLAALRGKWVMLHADAAECPEDCARRLWEVRQVRAGLNEGQLRVERAWLVLGGATPNPAVVAAHGGLRLYRADAAFWREFLPVPPDGRIEDHVYLIDPLGHLMLRWPRDVDPKAMRQDLQRLLRASRIG